MSQYRQHLPQLDDALFLTDGGLETTLIFHEGLELPCFASFDLLKNEQGTALLRSYYQRYLALARRYGVGAVLESPTWRANPDWGARLGHDHAALVNFNHRAIDLMQTLRAESAAPGRPIVISGNLGPRGDGYRAAERMSAAAAQQYHAPQIEVFADSPADMVAAFTMNYAEEAIGIVRAARAAHMPVAISFTVETDGCLPSGESLAAAVERTDQETSGAAAYYMINCAHPTHFEHVLESGAPWLQRLRGLRANASRCSHAELDESTELDAGDPADLGSRYAALRARLPHLSVLGGCCGTDHRHVAAIFEACPA